MASLSESACRGLDPALFYPDETSETYEEDVQAAKAVCSSCPAKSACLDLALSTDERLGIWGGTTPEEREEL